MFIAWIKEFPNERGNENYSWHYTNRNCRAIAVMVRINRFIEIRSLETLNLLMELLRKSEWSMFFMLFHGQVLLRTFWMNLQSSSLRRWRKCTSLYIIIKKNPVVDFHTSRSLHILLGCISLLKKFMQYSWNWTSSFKRRLQNRSQIRNIEQTRTMQS